MTFPLNRMQLVLMTILVIGSAAFSQEHFVTSSARELPVSKVVDVLVVGVNEGGIAAAWKAGQAGRSVLVLSGHYFLSDVVAAQARYWLEADEVPQGAFSRALFGTAGTEGGIRAIPLTPWQYKTKLEDLLRDAGVAYHYNTRPVAALHDAGGDIAGVVVSNKAGIQAICAKVVIDATPTGAVARMMGAQTTPWRVEQVDVSRVAYKNNVSGSVKRGDFYEYSLTVPMTDGSWPERNKAEVLLRDKHNTANWKETNKAYAQEMHMIEPVSIITESTLTGTSWPSPGDVDLDVFRPRNIPYLYVLSQSAGVPRDLAKKLTRPVHLADVGERIGDAGGREAAQRTAPQRPTVVTPEPGRRQGTTHRDAGADWRQLWPWSRRLLARLSRRIQPGEVVVSTGAQGGRGHLVEYAGLRRPRHGQPGYGRNCCHACGAGGRAG